MPQIQDERAKISISEKRATIGNVGVKQDSSGGKQLFDSGLLFDSGIYFDRWGSNPLQGEIAKIGKSENKKSSINKIEDRAKIDFNKERT